LHEKKPTIFLVADSTMADKPTDDNPVRGWGQMFREYFTNDVEIQNHAVNGRSTKSFINEHRWDTVMCRLSEADFVMIKFGHNDSKAEDTSRAAPAHTLYKDNLIRFVNDVSSKAQQWANKSTGNSPNFWVRSLGWYGMALVDVLDHFPENNMHRDSLIAILNRFAKVLTNVQDKKSGLWYDVVDMPIRAGNYKEASASCMLAYTLAKSVRKGYLPASYLQNARKVYAGIVKEFLRTDSNGQLTLKETVRISGLATPTGNPICPTIKVSTNSNLTKRMNDIIDIDTGPVIEGDKTIEQMGEDILEYCIKAASGEIIPKAVLLNQDDFIPWKRGISL
jgi:lysophospholipase L1-like esterase